MLADPINYLLDKSLGEGTLVPSVRANVLFCVVAEPRRQRRPLSSPIDEITTDEYARGRGVPGDIEWVDRAVVVAVVGILLKPLDTMFGEVVYVVAVCLFEASGEMGSFHQKPRILPILIETQSLRHPHREDNMPFTIPCR